MHVTAVTTVTAHPLSSDDLTAAQYREIYDELRSKCALRAFVALIGSAVSIAWWSKYERGEAQLDTDRRNELRAAVGLPLLPPAVASVLAQVDPDATIYQVGLDAAERVILIGADAQTPLTMRLNGILSVVAESQVAHVTPVTGPRRRAARGTILVSVALRKRLNAARLSAGQTWEDFLAARVATQEELC